MISAFFYLAFDINYYRLTTINSQREQKKKKKKETRQLDDETNFVKKEINIFCDSLEKSIKDGRSRRDVNGF